MFRIPVATGAVERVTAAESGGSHEQLALIPGSDAIAGLRHRFTHPPEPFRCDLRAGAKPELLARLSGFGADEGSALADVESFTTAGGGGWPVQSFLVKPAGATRPAARASSGSTAGRGRSGPTAGTGAGTRSCRSRAGYAVALPNPRGSTGVSEAFLHGIWGNTWGEGCYDDVMAVADALAARPEVDPSRMVAMGGSFGGYMANWIGANSDRFRALVSHAGVFAFSHFHGTTDSPAFWALRMGGQTPWGDLERVRPLLRAPLRRALAHARRS